MKRIHLIILLMAMISCSTIESSLNKEETRMLKFVQEIIARPNNIIAIIDSSDFIIQEYKDKALSDKRLIEITNYLQNYEESTYELVMVKRAIQNEKISNGVYYIDSHIKYQTIDYIFNNKDDNFIVFVFSFKFKEWKLMTIWNGWYDGEVPVP